MSAFVGGNQTYQHAKSAEEMRLVQLAAAQAATDSKVDAAIMARDKRMAAQAFMRDPNVPDVVKHLVVGGLGSNYASTMRGEGDRQEQGFRGDAVKAALSGDMNAANANLFGVAKGPVKLTDVIGGQVVRNAFSTEGTVAPTNVAEAQAENSRASASAHFAQAALTRDKLANPERHRAASTGTTAKGQWTDPTVDAIHAYFGNPDGMYRQSDGTERRWKPEERAQRAVHLRDFEQWRVRHPEYRNGAQALLQYKLSKDRPHRELMRDKVTAALTGAPGTTVGAGSQTSTPAGGVTVKVPGIPEAPGVTAVSPAVAQAAPAIGPHPEGTILKNKVDGRTYIVRNGVPVLLP